MDIAKITRRARRAWRDSSRRIHRISDVTATSLKYRIPEPGNYYGSRKVLVILEDDGTIRINGALEADTLDLLTLADLGKLATHVGKVRAYKGVSNDYGSPTHQGSPKLTYRVGDTPTVPDADTSDTKCAKGVNLGPKSYVDKEYKSFKKMAVEFICPDDLASVPKGTDGKFRVFRCKVVQEL